MSEIIEIEDFKAARICTDLCEFAHFYREGRAVIYHDNPGIFEIGKREAEAIAEMAMRADTEITKLKSQLEEARAALAPFRHLAKEAEDLPDSHAFELVWWYGDDTAAEGKFNPKPDPIITARQLRVAAGALNGSANKEGWKS